jgi:hypothetical protein
MKMSATFLRNYNILLPLATLGKMTQMEAVFLVMCDPSMNELWAT